MGRGEHVNEKDLLEAINNSYISGATLDVVKNEPITDTHPLKTHPNIKITNHTAATIGLEESMECIAKKIIAIEEKNIPIEQISGYIAPHTH